jgi:Tol biopolymer transport system component
VFRPRTQLRPRFVWFDRNGRELETFGDEGQPVSNPSLSRDGRHLVVQRTVGQNIDVWSLDLSRRGTFQRLTFDPDIDSMPLWSPDGRRIVFNSGGGAATVGLYIKYIDGSAADAPVPLRPGPGPKIACDWSSDGRFLLYKQFDAGGATDLWALPLDGDHTPIAVAQTPYDERDGQFSPDGKWVAYESNDSGKSAIYLQPFPGRGERRPVSTAGGTQVRWSADGRELFYVAADGSLMAVPVDAAANAGAPMRLFNPHLAPVSSVSRQQYVVDPGGQRFLMITAGVEPAPPITLLLHWKGLTR